MLQTRRLGLTTSPRPSSTTSSPCATVLVHFVENGRPGSVFKSSIVAVGSGRALCCAAEVPVFGS